jgi:serine/threonine protein kinase
MELRDRLGATLGQAYTIERELAAGGMSRVFVADETRLRRKVVIKVLPIEIAGEISVERFTREIQVVARLQHPHIVPLLTAGDAGGVPFYTMPFVQGESLRARLTAQGRLTVDEAVRLAIEIADALAYAHSQGIVHRDIKPDNVLLSGGHALVADFGIAKALDAAKTPGVDAITTAEGMVGTPAYMSPEQAAGESTDPRCDVYSLGVVLYEMLSGKPAFGGPTTVAVMAKRFAAGPPRLRTINAAIPPGLERIVERAMALEPAGRFATASELIDALRSFDRVAPRTDKSIAVLAFANMSGDAESEYFSDGVAEDIINALVHVQDLRVAARTSSFAFKGKPADVRSIGSALGVDTVLEGSVRRSGTRIRVTAQLVNVADGYHLWSERYDRDLEDVFAIQDEIAMAIVGQLELRLAAPDGRLVRPGTTNLEAYDLYLRGRAFWAKRGVYVRSAQTCFTRAVAADPGFAAAHAGLADCGSTAVAFGYATVAEVAETSRTHAYRALELNDRLAESHFSVAMFEAWMTSRFTVADREFARAAELNPAWALPVVYQAYFSTLSGHAADTPALARRARQIEPLSSDVHSLAAIAFIWARHFDDAAEAAQRALELDPAMTIAHFALAAVHLHHGRYQDALTACRFGTDLTGSGSTALLYLGVAMTLAGRAKEAAAIAGELEGTNRLGQAAMLRWALGERERALQILEKVPQELGPVLIQVQAPVFDDLADDDRFLAMLRRLGHDEVIRAYHASPFRR